MNINTIRKGELGLTVGVVKLRLPGKKEKFLQNEAIFRVNCLRICVLST